MVLSYKNKTCELRLKHDVLEASPCDHSDSNQPYEENAGRPSNLLDCQNGLRHKLKFLALVSATYEPYRPRSPMGQSGEEMVRYNGMLKDHGWKETYHIPKKETLPRTRYL